LTSSNSTRITQVRETTPGTTPTTPRMRRVRFTQESLKFNPEYVDSDEIRDDRMIGDPIKIFQGSSGSVNFELSYPNDESPASDWYRSAFWSAWNNTPQRDNDGTADSVITAITGTTDVVTVTTGAAIPTRALARMTGNATAANNGVFLCTTGSATVPAFVGAGFVTEAAPPAASRLKVVGFQGASGDITATADGLASTALDFTTMNLVVGQWIKVGGTLDASTFAFLVTAGAAARAGAFMRVTAIAAGALTCDNLPSGWTTDAGTGKTIKVWFGDYIRNGSLQTAVTIEKGFMGQSVPTYIVNTGMVVNTMEHSISNKQKITGVVNFTGMGGGQSTTTLDAAPDAATLGQVMAAHANVGRLAEAGSKLTSPNWGRELTFQINNNNRTVDPIDETSSAAIREGEFSVSGKINTYFGSNSLLAKFYDGTQTSLNARVAKNSQALIFQFPRVTLRGDGSPVVGGKNSDVMASFDWTASMDTTLNCHMQMDRLEYYEA
jgi:hypothetical protein